MTLWNPEYKILIDGQNLTSITLVGLTIQSGRTNIYNQPNAGYCSLRLINQNNQNYNINVNSSLTVEIKNSVGTYVPIFGGKISDVSQEVHSSGSTGYVTNISIIALGAIAKLYKAIWDQSLAQNKDGDQIYAILSTLLLNSWNEISSSQQWSTYTATETWANAQDIGLGDIDTPGQYTMEQRQTDPADFYSVVTQIANSALGYIYESANGDISYADANHRQSYLAANGYVEIDANAAYGPGLKTRATSANIINSVVVNYGNNFGNQKTSENTASIASYGRYQTTISSSIHNASDAQNMADRTIQLRAYPRPLFDSIAFPIQNTELDDGDRDALLGVFMGMPIRIINLPSLFGGGEFEGYVEGWTFTATVNGLNLDLTVSPTEFSAVAQTWEQVAITETWNTILATLQWEDAIGVIS